MTMTRYICEDCGWRGTEDQLLHAPSPFDAADTLDGCPHCLQVDTCRATCEEPDCWNPSTCGTPTATGYRRTCSMHVPKERL